MKYKLEIKKKALKFLKEHKVEKNKFLKAFKHVQKNN